MNRKINFIKTSAFMNTLFANFGDMKKKSNEATENPLIGDFEILKYLIKKYAKNKK